MTRATARSSGGKRDCLTVGVLTGTSADAIDVAVVRDAETAPRILAALAAPYPKKLRALALRGPTLTASEIAALHVALGEVFAAAVNRLLVRARVDRGRVSVIGSHGQTILHLPGRPHGWGRATLQLGAPAVIAVRTGIPVAADFRLDDVAVGGEGAPFAPLLDQLLLADQSRSGRPAALNLGGIANVTIVENGRVSCAYDIGPANTLIDAAMRKWFDKACDRGGRIARSGRVDERMLKRAMSHAWFRRKAPKSTGPELFSVAFLDDLVKHSGCRSGRDVVATLTEFTALSVARDLSQRRATRVFVSGGGGRNPVLIERLRAALLPIPLESSAALGVDPDFKEAVLFAHLGALRLRDRPSDLRAVTGAHRPKILGGLWMP